MSFGYVGDSTPDENSLMGIGAFNDTPGSLVDGYSAALKRSGAAEMGLAPGDTFEQNGRTYKWDDVIPEWSPVSKDYVDVYEPNHPADPNVGPNELARQREIFNRIKDRQSAQAQAKEEVGLSDEQIQQKYGSYLPDYKDSGQSADPPPKEQQASSTITPIETLKAQFPGLNDYQLIGKMHAVFPDVPVDKLAVYAKQPDGGKLIKEEMTRGLTPLESFKKLYPDRVGNKSDDQIIDWMHEHLEPNTPKDLFKDKVNPPPAVVSDLKNGILAGAQQTYAKWDQFPKAATDALAGLYKAAGIYGWEKDASAWLAKSVPGYAAADDYFKGFVNHLNERGKEFEKQADQAQAQISPGITGAVAGTAGQIAGSIPDIAVSFGLGSTSKAAALWGMAYEGTSAYGHAVENQQKNALAQGVQAAGFRGFSQYLMNTGSGRVAAGIQNSIATVADAEVEKWLRGEPNDITKDAKAATVGLLTGVLMGGHAKEAPKFSKAQLEGKEEVNPSGKPEPKPTPSAQQEFQFNYSPPVNEELNKALEHHENGNHDQASEHIDRAMALMTDSEKQEATDRFTQKVDEIGGNGAPVDQMRPAIRVDGEVFTGVTHAHAWQNADEPHYDTPQEMGYVNKRTGKFITQDEYEAKGGIQDENKLPREPDHEFNDYYYSGVAVPVQAIRDFAAMAYEKTGAESAGRKLRGTWRPEKISVEAEGAGAIIKSEEARSRAAQAVIPAEIARANQIEQVLKLGDRSEVRERFFNKFNENERTQQFIDYQEGTPLKDQTAHGIWERVYRPIYDMLDKREKAYGIEHEVVDNYFQQLFPHTKDEQFRLLEDAKRQGGGPAYTKHRRMTFREHIMRGDKPVTSNPERLMQMRWWSSEMAIQKIRDMRELEAQNLAYNAKDPNMPPGFKDWPVQPTANGESYHVHPDLVPILNNKFGNRVDLFKTWAGPYFKTLAFLKGGTSALLSWSGFHPLHILDITSSDVSADAYQRRQAGVGTWEDATNEALNVVPWVGGGVQGAKAYLKYRDPVNALKGHVDMNTLGPQARRDIKDFQDMGLVVEINKERQMQFSEGMSRLVPQLDTPAAKMAARALGMVWDQATGSPFTKWWFGEVTPRLKFASAMMRRDTLLRTRPELFQSGRRMDLLKEYQKINRDIEGRFGEMHYDNLLWPKWLKQAGQTHLLALGWQLGTIRTMGDGVIDLTTNAAHWDEIVAKSKNLKELERNTVTNRMAFQAAYMARGALTGMAIAYLVGRVSPTIWDMFYPRVGKDDQGHDKRVNMQFFTKDIPALNEYTKQEGSLLGGLKRMGQNKMNPMAMTVFQALTDRDYMGKPIGELPDKIWYILKQSSPISLQNALAQGGGVQGAVKEITQHPGDLIMDTLGYTPSAKWTMRSSTENEILQKSFHPDHQKITDAREKYRNAYLNKDANGMKEAEKTLKENHATDRQIKNIQKDAHLSTAEKAWKRLSKADKEDMLQKMPPGERKKWLNLSSKPVQKDMEHAGSVPN